MTHTVHMNQPTNRPHALGGLIRDTGVDADHSPAGLDFSCTRYVPERDGTLMNAEQTKRFRPLLEAINRGPDGDVGAHAVVGLPPVRKLTAFAIVPKELIDPTPPDLAEAARGLAEKRGRYAREDARHAELLAVGGAVTAVAELHSPDDHRDCNECQDGDFMASWPCTTWERLNETVPR